MFSEFLQEEGPDSGDKGKVLPAQAEALQRIANLEDRLNRALVVNEALWKIVQDRLEVTEKELRKCIEKVTLQENAKPGKKLAPRVCPKCVRLTNRRFQDCQYCGEALPKEESLT